MLVLVGFLSRSSTARAILSFLDANPVCHSCERESKWLDESAYAVDISILPRGGSRRRKSMEPRALLNMNGNLSEAAGVGRRSFSAEMTQKFKDELVNTPLRGHTPDQVSESAGPSDADEPEGETETEHTGSLESGFSTPTGALLVSTTSTSAMLPPATPTGVVNYDPSTSQTPGAGAAAADGACYSPTTPYYLSQGAKLVQMTCPPKQTGKGLFEKEDEVEGAERGVGEGATGTGFPVSGRIGDVQDEKVRKRLAEARRKTMGWRPRVGSPLGR